MIMTSRGNIVTRRIPPEASYFALEKGGGGGGWRRSGEGAMTSRQLCIRIDVSF